MKQLNWYQIFGQTHTIPDGRTVTPTDDIQIWLNCADIWDKTYTTLAEVLADTTTLAALIASSNAVDYMVRSTTWAVAQALVPTMTSATTPSGTVLCSTPQNAEWDGWCAFNAEQLGFISYGATKSTSANQAKFLGYDFETPEAIGRIELYNDSTATANPSGTLSLQWSDDNSTWETIDSVSYNGAGTYSYNISESNAHRYWRVYTLDGSNKNAQNYLLLAIMRAQFYSAASITNNSTAMSYIGLNNYCANTLLADSTWCNAICNSEYSESVLNVKVPTMTSNTTPSGEAFAISVYNNRSDLQPWKVFDNSGSSKWSSGAGDVVGAYVGYKFTSSVKIVIATVTIPDPGNPNNIKKFKIQGYDGERWNDVSDVFTVVTSVSNYLLTNITSNERYRIYVTEAVSGSGNINLAEVQFYGREDV